MVELINEKSPDTALIMPDSARVQTSRERKLLGICAKTSTRHWTTCESLGLCHRIREFAPMTAHEQVIEPARYQKSRDPGQIRAYHSRNRSFVE